MPAGLPPVATADARVLVLGSLPGRVSIERQQYYANPRNAMWDIVEQYLHVARDQEYDSRAQALRESGVALWDVLAFAERKGSLDSAIVSGTEVPNDIVGFVREHPDVEVILLNGSKAARLFRRFAQPALKAAGIQVGVIQLPSTSPANTRYTAARKLKAWTPLVERLRGT